MSYRNPRFFKEDYTLINRSFQQAFTAAYKGAQDFYDKIEAEQKEYESDVQVRSDLMKQDVANLKDLAAGTQAEILKTVNEFYDEATRVDLGGAKRLGLFAKNLDQERRSKTDLDLAAQNFTAAAQPLNSLFGMLNDLDEKGGLNKSSDTYLEFAAVVQAARNGFKKFDATGQKQFSFNKTGTNEFDMNIRIENPKWREGMDESKKYINVDSRLLATYIGNNNPELKARYDEAYSGKDGVLEGLKGEYTTRMNEIYANNSVPRNSKGFAITPEDFLKDDVKEYVNIVKGASGDETMITDIFNNSVDFGTSKRFGMLTSFAAGKPLLENLVKFVDEETDDVKKKEIVADLLETKHNDTSLNRSLLLELGVKEEDIAATIKGLNNLKNDMVAEHLYDEIYKDGLTSKYRRETAPEDDDDDDVKEGTTKLSSGKAVDAGVYDELKSIFTEGIKPHDRLNKNIPIDQLQEVTKDDIEAIKKLDPTLFAQADSGREKRWSLTKVATLGILGDQTSEDYINNVIQKAKNKETLNEEEQIVLDQYRKYKQKDTFIEYPDLSQYLTHVKTIQFDPVNKIFNIEYGKDVDDDSLPKEIPMLQRDKEGNYIQGKGSRYGFNTLAAVLLKGLTTPSKLSTVKEILRSFMDGNEPGVDAFDFDFGVKSKEDKLIKDQDDFFENLDNQTDPIDELINSID
mgnify:CR=1 FL=1